MVGKCEGSIRQQMNHPTSHSYPSKKGDTMHKEQWKEGYRAGWSDCLKTMRQDTFEQNRIGRKRIPKRKTDPPLKK